MWQPVKIKIVNFKSFVDQEYSFKKGAYLIQGDNQTDEGQKSNGSGKSAFRETLCYVFDLPIYCNSLTDLINNNAKECEVQFSLHNTLTNDDLDITKKTLRKGGSVLKIELNGEDQADKFASVPLGHKHIISILGVSKEDLINHYIISKEKYKGFFSSSDKEVKELIGRFSNFNRIDGVEDIVDADVNELEGDIRLGESNLAKLQGKIELLQEQLEAEKLVDVKVVKSTMITEFEDAILKYAEKIIKFESRILNFSNGVELVKIKTNEEKVVLKIYEEELTVLKELNYKKEIGALNDDKKGISLKKVEVGEEIKEFNLNLKAYSKFQIEVETAIEGSIECPKCFYEFIPNNEISIEEAKKTLPQILDEIKGIEKGLKLQDVKLDEFDKSISDFNEKIQEYDFKITKFNDLKRGIINKKNNKKNLIISLNQTVDSRSKMVVRFNNSIKQTESYIVQAEEGIIEAKKQEIETREKEIQESLDKLAEEILTKEDEIQAIKDKQFGLEQWIHRFKKFKSSLANESLEIISGYANMYLEKMKTNLSIVLEGFKTLKNGDIREKITPIILRNGEQEGTGNFKKFSGGERVKIDFVTSVLALQSLINNSCESGGLNLLVIDEILEGLDGLGLENLVASINDLDKYCLITSHVTHEKVHENILTIEKINGISRILN